MQSFERERGLNRLTLFQRISYWLLRIAVGAFVLCLILSTLLWLVLRADWSFDFEWLVNAQQALLFGLFWTGLVTPILFLLTLPMMIKTLGQLRLIRRLGLSNTLLREPMEFNGGLSWFKRLAGLITILVGLLLFFGGVLAALWFAIFFEPSSAFSRVVGSKWSGMWTSLSVAGLGLMLPSLHYLHRAKLRLERAEDVARLLTLLGKGETERVSSASGTLAITSTDRDRIANIEQSQIVRSRAEAIQESLSHSAESGYAVAHSRNALERLRSLDFDSRWRVENRIQDLLRDPRPAEAEAEGDSDRWRVHVSETKIDLIYQIDDTQQRVFLLAVEAQATTKQAGSTHA